MPGAENKLKSHIRRFSNAAISGGGLPDADLVRRFAEHRDAAAFEVLVWRHGPMVWAAARRILRHQQDAEDAFQASFLALVRCAHSVGRRGPVAAWLHRVVVNAALKLKARRLVTTESLCDPVATDDPSNRELMGVLDEELTQLPERYRVAFVLCCLRGLTSAEAARELGCPVGTVDSRLHAARTRLRVRLTSRGFGPCTLSAVTVAVVLPSVASAVVGYGASTLTPPPALTRLASQIGVAIPRRTPVTVVASVLGLTCIAVAVWAFEASPPTPRPEPPSLAFAPVPWEGHVDPALLFTELVLKPGETGSSTLRLTRATFRDGKLTHQDALHSGNASEFGFQSHYRLINGRYVVFQSTTVFDLLKNQILYSFDRGRVIAVEGTAVYFDNANAKDRDPSGVLRYDVATGVVDKVAEPGEGRWGLRGAVSPKGTKAIVREWKNVAEFNGTESSYILALDRPGKPRESLAEFEASYGITGSGWTDDSPPGVWLDDDRFLTQKTPGKIVILNTAEKKQEKVVQIALTHRLGEKVWDTIGVNSFAPLGLRQPRFSLLPDGRVLYEADLVYVIDVAKKTWKEADWCELGYGFDYSAVPDQIKDVDRNTKTVTVTLRYQGKAIGKSERVWQAKAEKPRVVTTDGYVAVIEHMLQPGKAVPTETVRVWSAATGQWQTLGVWADSLIGWVK